MYEIESLLVVVFLAAAVVLFLHFKPQYAHWRLRKQMLDDLDDRYESLRKMRRELIYHSDWARERGDLQDAIKLEPEIDRVEKELADVARQYKEIESGGKIPNKAL